MKRIGEYNKEVQFDFVIIFFFCVYMIKKWYNILNTVKENLWRVQKKEVRSSQHFN